MLSPLLLHEDPDAAKLLLDQLISDGVTIYTSVKILNVEYQGGEGTYTLLLALAYLL